MEEGGLNVNKRYTQIKELIEKTKAALPKEEIHRKDSKEKILKDKILNLNKKDSESSNYLENEEVKICNSKKGRNKYLEKEKDKASGRKGIRRNENNYKISNNYKGKESESSPNYKYNMNMNRKKIKIII